MATQTVNVVNADCDVHIINCQTDNANLQLDITNIENCHRNRIFVKRIDTNASFTANITTNGGTIDGQSSFALNPLSGVELYWDDVLDYWVILADKG